MIPFENAANHENLRNSLEKHENHENQKIPIEN